VNLGDGQTHRYQVRCSPRVSKDLRSLPSGIQFLIEVGISSLSVNPRPKGAERLKEDRTTWRLRVGDYRILYWIDDKSAQVLVDRVSHRRDAYPKKGNLTARVKSKNR